MATSNGQRVESSPEAEWMSPRDALSGLWLKDLKRLLKIRSLHNSRKFGVPASLLEDQGANVNISQSAGMGNFAKGGLLGLASAATMAAGFLGALALTRPTAPAPTVVAAPAPAPKTDKEKTPPPTVDTDTDTQYRVQPIPGS